MVQMEATTRLDFGVMLSRREQLIMLEIGVDSISSASSFVEYMEESYSISKSSLWYTLKRLKERNLIDFATKDEPGKSLVLTQQGRNCLSVVERSKIDILRYFTGTVVSEAVGMQRRGYYQG